ncbi:MAG: hypothetical protein IPO15_01485 [Anaerolineae bacterium]|uniref:hypothetical protein n=1 Tax=Candidatus Amarolinea dominans TaxID=3140696 RepID=UPI0031353BB6|nr:hypothetical protein [Anaerolineae bacterium]
MATNAPVRRGRAADGCDRAAHDVWTSILDEKVALDLAPLQVKQAETQRAAADSTVTRGSRNLPVAARARALKFSSQGFERARSNIAVVPVVRALCGKIRIASDHARGGLRRDEWRL